MSTQTLTWAVIAALLLIILVIWAQLLRQARILRLAKAREGYWLEQACIAIDAIRTSATTPRQLTEEITKVTGLQAWHVQTTEAAISETQVETSPFWVDPNLANMALRTQKAVRQRQLSQWGWAFAYIPISRNGTVKDLFALASTSRHPTVDQAFAAVIAEYMCLCWERDA